MRIRCSGSATSSSRAFSLLHDGGEGVLLNQEKQALFGFEVIIKPRQRHAAGAGKIAHGSAFVSFFAEDFRGMSEDLCQAAVEARRRRLTLASDAALKLSLL